MICSTRNSHFKSFFKCIFANGSLFCFRAVVEYKFKNSDFINIHQKLYYAYFCPNIKKTREKNFIKDMKQRLKKQKKIIPD